MSSNIIGIIGKTINTGLGTMTFSYKNILENTDDIKNVYVMDSHEINKRSIREAEIYTRDWIKKCNINKLIMFEPVRPTMWSVLSYIRDRFSYIELYGVPMIDRIIKIELHNYKIFNKILCSTRTTYSILKNNGLTNLYYVGWGIDTSIFSPNIDRINNIINSRHRKFFHNAGWGGDAWRKNTTSVVVAFDKACKRLDNIELHIHTQKSINRYPKIIQYVIKRNVRIKVTDSNVPFSKVAEMTKASDISILPSKWEGLGIPLYESMACGVPVVTVDHFPMNEIVSHNYNGLCCKFIESNISNNPSPLYSAADVIIDDMVEKICYISDIKNNSVLYNMSIAARNTIMNNYTIGHLTKNLLSSINL